MKNVLKILGAIFCIAGAVLIFLSGDIFSIIFEIVGIGLSLIDLFLPKRKETNPFENTMPEEKVPRFRNHYDK